jgi:hypothetical protein
MAAHEEFLELCAAATAGELSAAEQAKLKTHLASCAACRRAMGEYEKASRMAMAILNEDSATEERDTADSSWSAERAEREFFRRLDQEEKKSRPAVSSTKTGQRFSYHPSSIRWREIWMPFAAAILLALALGIAAYKSGLSHGTDVAGTVVAVAKDSAGSLEEQVSDAGHERAQLLAQLQENSNTISDLKRQLSEQQRIVNGLKAADRTEANSGGPVRPSGPNGNDFKTKQEEELAAARARVNELQKTIEAASTQHDEALNRAASLEAKVSELSGLVRDRGLALDRKEAEVTRQQELLEHDRDIRELMGARDLYMAEIHDVSKAGTDRTYGRVFYTKGKSLIFYAYDLDAQPGIQNASFQAWGRRGPDKQQALNLGIFYEDNQSKKRWVLKANDPKTLQDIDAVFVTVEPNGGSHHPSGKQLLFAYLRISPNHP